MCGEGGLAALSPVSGTGSLPTGLSADRTHHRLAHRWFRRPRAGRRKEGRVEEPREEGRKGGVSEGGEEGGKVEDEGSERRSQGTNRRK